MEQASEAKSARMLDIYARLMAGQVLNKIALAEEYGVTLRSIQRDMESLRFFLMEKGLPQEVIYDRSMKGYRMVNSVPSGLSNSEILAVCKILLESRSMRRDEMLPILDKLVECAVPQEQRRAVKELIANEKLHYIEPHHGKNILNGLWDIGQAVKEHRVMEIEYERMKEPKLVKRRIQPVGIMFSEYYFYLTAFLENKESFENPDDLFPTIYRIDRIRGFKVLDEHFHVPYSERFEEGEFRKRVQFMYGGKLQHIKFRYTGPSLEAVLDRLPTAKILSEDSKGWTVEAEVFGKGIEMWIKSQGNKIEIVGLDGLKSSWQKKSM